MAILNPILTPRRYLTVVLVTVISLHYFLSTSSTEYGHLTSFGTLKEQMHLTSVTTNTSTIALAEPYNHSTALQPVHNNNDTHFSHGRRANATFVFLCRNSDLNGVVSSIVSMEDRFNRAYSYPWVFLNDEEFTEEFKQRVRVLTDAPMSFGVIPREHWVQPDWIDENRARQGRMKLMNQRVIYGGSIPYRNMCRFNSGFFFQHELLQPYRYYWRVEPNVKFFCGLDYDPFLYMEEHDKVYSFTISLLEHQPTVPTLWDSVKEFISEYPYFIEPENAMNFISDDGGEKYNLCHWWSNFEIADMDFWRGEAYTKFFEFLEAKGGFYYERWGDAPVHSIAAALFARKDQIHFFRDIGYRHEDFQHCPSGIQWSAGRCACDPKDTFDYSQASCLPRFEGLFQ
ncbi:glycosyltransferase family 15 protein [Mycena rosella]|uniref:Glycosyltransferase family 15 protein n=1 Tax=Mycena rosella TaxID=1033263 RepID=A0AAD7MC00_MYCRO|nr:glycosyltransferase family 15 protein [Mycena rosella]